ncbi:FAD-dependent pyridine nucleotide-disulfide oxidoreductase [Talaromyces proteolyticus]|uniref:FAD-dependent pyridine nucleotide-disulfide oxidoreductase n=1 Tax=Talaromyces proteolyticus TaxID=1131652 RepID=A0AAD4KKG4_9EURO|nr:FAD-dependent pyridine nucleotide-disulfide oxidoreductase [Talaromyces proteolyticus]KAH8694878.1 FAD-dependent pyridine nucleotide-disulfide oxidoreductase [Talaromyces proteolyticus]
MNAFKSKFRNFLSTMATIEKYDAIIIGSGQSGNPLAIAYAKQGQKTALVERKHIAGCCVNEGCTPTKTLIASGRVAYLTRRGQDFGIHTSDSKTSANHVAVDMLKVRQRKRDIVSSFRAGSESRLKAAGVHILKGEASFVGQKELNIKDSTGKENVIQGEKIYINVGDRPAPPLLEGISSLDPGRILDSTSIQELDEVPSHLVVIGGGYVGVEFAQLFRRLGAQVTVIHRGAHLLSREDPEIADLLAEVLQQDGLTIHMNSSAVRIAVSNNGFDLTVQTSNGNLTIAGTHILFAAGRIPNTDTLKLEAANIAVNKKGYIVTNEYLETSSPSVFAIGDVKGPPAFTHLSYDDFRIIQSNILSKSPAKLSIKDRIVPYVVYTDPQLAHVGLHEGEAREKYPDRKIQTAKMPMGYVARALETDEPRGMMKAVVDCNTGLILGFTCLGLEGGEIMSIVQMAMIGNIPYEKLQNAIWAHPTLAESLNNLWAFLE